MSRAKGFTLPELLVVVGVIAILAAILFPVLATVKASAKQAACASNFRQAHMASMLYVGDYDDRFMPVNYELPDLEREVQKDRTWVQLLLPYVEEFGIFRCPENVRAEPRNQAIFDIDLLPGDSYGRYYRESLLSNIGLNYLYLSPFLNISDRWLADPRPLSEVGNPSRMLMYVDTISGVSGRAAGSYIVAPPCRYWGEVDTFRLPANAKPYAPTPGWSPAGLEKFGRAWAWHNSRTNVVRVDGSSKSLSMAQLAEGCEVKDRWKGKIFDQGSYNWDLD
jgi:prepilin-type N-terminal cleavage/methylation domain-containing protein